MTKFRRFAAIFLAMVCIMVTAACEKEDDKPDTGDITGPEATSQVAKDPEDLSDNPLKVVFFEIGKADAFLIYNKGATILIDTGESENAEEILEYMEKKEISSLDYLFITHFDKDHVGGASRIMEGTEVKQVYTSNYPKSSGEYDNFKKVINKKDIPAAVLRENTTLSINGIDIEVNTPIQDVYDEDPSNNSSLIIRVAYGEKSFLFMGDAMGERIREYLATDIKECSVIKMPYHGNYLPGLDELLKKARPKYAVITSSKEMKEAEETNQTLKDHNVQIYKTRKGRVIIETDGRDISVTQK